MRCDQVRELLWPDPRPRPGPAGMAEALDHYGQCAACQGYFRREAELVRRLGRLATVTAPAGLRARIAAALETARPARGRRWAVAGVSAALAAAALGLVVLRPTSVPPEATRPLVVEARVGLDEAAMASSDLAQIEAWLAERLGYRVVVPDITDATPVGARIATLGGASIPMAVYVYANGMPLSYFALPSGELMGVPVPGRDVLAVSSNGHQVALWTEQGLVRAVVAPMHREALIEIARECQRKAAL